MISKVKINKEKRISLIKTNITFLILKYLILDLKMHIKKTNRSFKRPINFEFI
jgi:hypothetical protein